jgi:hypothetical protein
LFYRIFFGEPVPTSPENAPALAGAARRGDAEIEIHTNKFEACGGVQAMTAPLTRVRFAAMAFKSRQE